MIKTFVASTVEVDDISIAVEEILSQIKPETNLLENSVGIISCHYEFVESGVVEAVCDALPFDIAGTISWIMSAGEETDTFLMTLMVLTSDDVEFDTVLTPSLNDAPGKVIEESYKDVTAERNTKPALVFSFAPFMPLNSGDEYVDIITKASGGVPVFGTLAIDDNPDFKNAFMIYNGQPYRDRMAMILCYGNINPKFYTANISNEKVLDKTGIITKSDGHVIMEVNGRPIDAFFEDLGLIKASETYSALSTMPFMLDYNDGTPKVSKIFIMLTPERYALCAGAVPEGCTLQIATPDKSDILLTTKKATEQILKDAENASGLLIYSCVSRSMTLGVEQLGEAQLVSNLATNKLPHMMLCSGGEICPTQIENGIATNRFHNNAFIACLF